MVRRRDGVIGPLLVAWWTYCVASLIPVEDDPASFMLLVFSTIGITAFVTRLFVYLGSYRPPIGIWGRIMTGRWIIPGYDYVLLAPLCILLVELLGGVAGSRAAPATAGDSGYGLAIYPLATAAALIVALNMGPSLPEWRLTGHHRIVPWCATDPKAVKL